MDDGDGYFGLALAGPVALRGLELHPDEAILYFNLYCYLSEPDSTDDGPPVIKDRE